ncbi:MAG: hypothetical protein AAF597_15980, partial [Bacteroidota bacterium]
MKLLYTLLILCCFTTIGTTQSTLVVNSTDGYSVSLTLEPTAVVVTNPCPNGYNYNLEFAYDLQFTGSNIPASLWDLSVNVACGNGGQFLAIPRSPGVGTITTTSNVYQPDCSVAPD